MSRKFYMYYSPSATRRRFFILAFVKINHKSFFRVGVKGFICWNVDYGYFKGIFILWEDLIKSDGNINVQHCEAVHILSIGCLIDVHGNFAEIVIVTYLFDWGIIAACYDLIQRLNGAFLGFGNNFIVCTFFDCVCNRTVGVYFYSSVTVRFILCGKLCARLCLGIGIERCRKSYINGQKVVVNPIIFNEISITWRLCGACCRLIKLTEDEYAGWNNYCNAPNQNYRNDEFLVYLFFMILSPQLACFKIIHHTAMRLWTKVNQFLL